MQNNKPDKSSKGGRGIFGEHGNALALDTRLVEYFVLALERNPGKRFRANGWDIELAHGRLNITNEYRNDSPFDQADYRETLSINLSQPNQGSYRYSGFDSHPAGSIIMKNLKKYERNENGRNDQSEMANEFLLRLRNLCE